MYQIDEKPWTNDDDQLRQERFRSIDISEISDKSNMAIRFGLRFNFAMIHGGWQNIMYAIIDESSRQNRKSKAHTQKTNHSYVQCKCPADNDEHNNNNYDDDFVLH